MKVDDVGLLEFGQGGDVSACVCDVHGKEVVLFEAIGFPDDDTLPYKLPYQFPATAQGNDRNLFRLLVAHEQFGLDAIVLQGFHQAAGSYGCSTDTLGCID